MIIKIAFRNIFRNIRRSLMTILAIAVGASSMLLFGQFVFRVFAQIETRSVANAGHLTVFRRGYFEYGGGNPGAYGIHDYQAAMDLFAKDPQLKPQINVITPIINVFGIAGNFDADASRTFIGRGMVPEDFNKMLGWDEHHLGESTVESSSLNTRDENHGLVGIGLAKILKLNALLDPKDAPADQGGDVLSNSTSTGKPQTRDFGSLGEDDRATDQPDASETASSPRIDLLAATASGAPNVVSLYVDKASGQGFKEMDDAFVALNFNLAQQLLYGRGEKKAIGIVLQLHRTEDMRSAKARLQKLIQENKLDLEVRDLLELQPFYKQAVGMFSAIFTFISAIMVVIVLFTVVNTMSMSVIERTPEIGTLRSMGVRRSGITLQFVAEGALLGVIGVTVGLAMGFIVSRLINHAGLTWQPPGQAFPIPLQLMDHELGRLIFAIWFGLLAMAALAAWIPARRAARMTIVNALGHV